MPLLIGYGRPDPADARADEQRERLLTAGCDPIFIEQSGAKAFANRSRGKAIRSVTAGSMLTVTTIDRLGASLVDIVAVLQRIFAAGGDLRVLDSDLDTARDPAAREALLAMIGAQSQLVSARARESVATRRAAGKRVGPPARLQPEQWPEVKAMFEAKASAAEMTARFDVSRQTLWNFRQRMEAAETVQSPEPSAKS